MLDWRNPVFGAMYLAVVLLMALAVASVQSSRIPNQPLDAFGNRTVTPIFAYSFRQSECAAGTIEPDIGPGPSLFVNKSFGGMCPSRGGFESAIIGAGVEVSRPDEPNAIVSGPVGSALDALTNPSIPGPREMTIEVWFSLNKELDADTTVRNDVVLLEWGGRNGANNLIGSGSDSAQLQLKCTVANNIYEVRLEVMVNDNNTEIRREGYAVSNYLPTLSLLGDPEYVEKIFMLVVTIASNNHMTFYLGTGESMESFTEENTKLNRHFILNATHVIRLGCTRSPSLDSNPERRGFPGAFHFLAFYNRSLSGPEVSDMFSRGLPNSLPAVKGLQTIMREDVVDGIDLNNTELIFDMNKDSTKSLWVNRPEKGILLYNNVEIPTDNFEVYNSSLLRYKSSLNAEDGNTFNCTADHEEDDRFTFFATDGLCDRNDTEPGTTNCKSPIAGVVSICVEEENDPPEVVPPPGEFVVFAGAQNKKAFTVTCGDIDHTTSVFGLDKVNIVSNNVSLGQVVVHPNGTGDCGVAEVTTVAKYSTAQTAARQASLMFCYVANETGITTVKVGEDTISYECIDKMGVKATGTLTVVVVNALFAGCGDTSNTAEQWSQGIPCRTRGVEDQPVVLQLAGYDAVASHNKSRRYYKIASLPPIGKLFTRDYSEVQVGDEIPADSGSIATVHEDFAFPDDKVPTAEGDLALIYVPDENWFNSLCGVNKDPRRNNDTGRAICDNSEIGPLIYKDGLDFPLSVSSSFPCGDKQHGCHLNFSFALGYDDPVQGLQFGPVVNEVFVFDIVGQNDQGSLTAPANISMQRTAFDFKVNGNETTTPLRYIDPDGDTYRVAFRIRVNLGRANLKARSFDNPVYDDPYLRLTLTEGGGSECLELGGKDCQFEGRAFVSDLNRFFDALSISTTAQIGNDTLTVEIWDPSYLASEYQHNGPRESLSDRDDAIISRTVLIFDRPTGASNAGNPLTTALWAGIIAGALFILMSCFAFWGCIIMRAKRGEEAAVWAVRNLLCTDIEHRKHADLSKLAAGGRQSLEKAIKAEHNRLARVVCCALFMKRVCPCIVKFDARELKVPDEEAMLQEAIN